jgi:hypothetical protein
VKFPNCSWPMVCRQALSVMSEVDYVKKESEEVLHADNFETQESDWQVQKELALLNAISKCKPVGKMNVRIYSPS